MQPDHAQPNLGVQSAKYLYGKNAKFVALPELEKKHLNCPQKWQYHDPVEYQSHQA